MVCHFGLSLFETIGDRFPDMYNCYNKGLVKLAEEVARERDARLRAAVESMPFDFSTEKYRRMK